jgi:hypothetical protein
MATMIDVPQQVPEAEAEEHGDGADAEGHEVETEKDEQRSGADWRVQAAARKRRLQMMGLSVPE